MVKNVLFVSGLIISVTLFSCTISSERFRNAIKEIDTNPQVFEELLDELGNPNKAIQYGTLPLHSAIWNESVPAMKMLIERGADPFREDNSFNAFYHAMSSATAKPLEILIKGFPEVLEDEYFIGFDVLDLLDTGRVDHFKVLLKAGVPVDGMTISSETYLQYACKYSNDYPESAVMLLEMGADPNLRDPEGWPPLLRTTRQETIIALLLKGAEINATGPKGHTAIFYNAANKRLWNVKTLLEYGALLEPNLVVIETYETTSSNTDWDWVENIGNPISILKGDLSYELVTTSTSHSHENAIPLLEYAQKHDEELAQMLISRGYK